ncbi:MAG: pilus assembly protein [Thermoflexales bacterium]|nr:pilus assembly protein [Thermoflexales bacterium]
MKKNKWMQANGAAVGQGLVEFALVVPVLVFLIMGIIDFGRIIAIYNEASNATREGLRYGLVNPKDCAGVEGVVKQSLLLIDSRTVAVTIQLDDGMAGDDHVVATCPIANPANLTIQPGWRLRVGLKTDVSPLTPIVNNLIASIPLSYAGARTVYNEAGVYQAPPPAGKIEGNVTAWGCQMVKETVQGTEERPIDVINVIDMSGSMQYGWRGNGDYSSPRKIQSAKDALTMFNNMMDIAFGDKVGLVTFPGTIQTVSSYKYTCSNSSTNKKYLAKVRSGLSTDVVNINGIIASLSADGYTPLADGIRKGRQAVLGAGHVEEHVPVLIVASDGMANVRPGTSDSDPINGRLTGFNGMDPVSPVCNEEAHAGVLNEALLAKEAGIIIFTIAIGNDFNADALQAAASPGFFFQVTSQEELEAAYASIRSVITTIEVREVPRLVEQPAEGAWIVINDGQGHSYNTLADANGNYTFFNIPYGNYTFQASAVYTGTTYDTLTDGVNGAGADVAVNLNGDVATQDLYMTTSSPQCVVGEPGTPPNPTPTGPAPTPETGPTPIPPTPAPLPLYVDITYPSSNGATVSALSQTGFEALAYDPDAGLTNGTGIAQVQFQLYTPSGAKILDRTESTVAYCVFSGDAPCAAWDSNASVSFDDAPNGSYTLKARAYSNTKGWSDWVERSFTLSKPVYFIQITNPAADGATISDDDQTAFEVVAYNEAVGTDNGDGVTKVEFQIYQGSTKILQHTDTQAVYCAFGNYASCRTWRNWYTNSSEYSSKKWNQVSDGNYTLQARVLWSTGVWSDWVVRTFRIDK